MMRSQTRFIAIMLVLFAALFLFGCTPKLEEKTKAELQPLNQVSTIGTKIGQIPPDFVVAGTEGRAIRLSSFAERKRPVLVYFMATWCEYCAMDYAALSKVYADYENNASIISVDLDLSEGFSELMDYKKKYPALKNTTFAPGKYEIMADYQVTKTTTKYAIGRNGTIIWAGIGALDEGQWKDLLGKLVSS